MKKIFCLLVLFSQSIFSQPCVDDYIDLSLSDNTVSIYPNFYQTIGINHLNTTGQGGGYGSVGINNDLLNISFGGNWTTPQVMRTGVILSFYSSPSLPNIDLGPILTAANGTPTGYYAKLENNNLIFYTTGSPSLITSCSFSTTEDLACNRVNWYLDADSDGYGNSQVFILKCLQPVGYVANNTDCNDSDASINPGNSLWYADNDYDGLGDVANFISQCSPPTGSYVRNHDDNCPLVVGTSGDCTVLPPIAQNLNYIKTTIYKGEGATLPVSQATYFDGLGRPIQQIANAQSNTGKDIVTHIEYDAFGRQTKEYLPFKSTQNTMNFIDSETAQQSTVTYYQTLYGDANPYNEKLLEASPINRVIKLAAQGNDWALGSGHEIKLDYQTNTATEVKSFNATASWNAGTNLYDISITDNGNYEVNQLYKTITKNENWTTGDNNTTQEFKNKDGQVVLKRTFGTSIVDGVPVNTNHDTFYVYDQFGNLTYVLPPLAEGVTTQTVLDGLCYQYKHDYRNRMVAKKIPGKQCEYVVYDNQDRPVATAPVSSPWGDGTVGVLISEYDVLGRVTQTGWKAMAVSETSRSGWQTNIMAGTNPFTLTENDILTKNYYDNYTYPNAPTLPTTLPDSTYPIAQNVKGLATGSWVRVLTLPSETNGESSYTFYDDKYRPVRNYTTNYLGGFTQVDSNLDFIGKTNYTITTHKRVNADVVLTVKDMFTYSAQDRLLLHTQQINALPMQLIASNIYDELGQLISKNVGGTDVAGVLGLQKVDYNYNIRGWLKGINDTANLIQGTDPKDLFAFKLSYNNPASTTALYNGNISETYWRTNSDNILRKYNYSYDNLNRLKDASYQKPDVASSQKNYNETLSYDKNGNIITLSRTGDSDSDGVVPENVIDELKFTYHPNNKNQLMKVFDNTNNPQGFKDDSDGTTDPADDYSYDANGNMTKDDNKVIIGINYNHLNLPTKITFAEANNIVYIYNAIGQKLEKKVTEATATNTTQYLGGYQYKNNVLLFFPNSEGYVKKTGTTYNYVFNYTDHLGNIRLSYTKDPTTGSLKILEENHYYPFGLKHTNYNSDKLIYAKVGEVTKIIPPTPSKPNPYLYKYNGKELQDELGLNWYDYGARFYDPARVGWGTVDPLAEKMRRWSPYNYAFDNPLRFIDPDGMGPDDVILGGADKQKALVELQKSVQGQLNLSMDSNGKVSYTNVQGVTPNADAQQLTTAVDDHSVTVNVNATNNKTTANGSLFIGGAFGGNTVTPSTTPGGTATVSANQEINPTVLGASDAPYGKPGGNTLHEVTEAYQGAKLSQASGVSSGDANAVGSVYQAAHTAATPQAGPIYETVYDASGNILPAGTYQGAVRAEYSVQPANAPSSIIMTFP